MPPTRRREEAHIHLSKLPGHPVDDPSTGAHAWQRRFGRVTAPAIDEAATRVAGRCGPHKNNKRNSLWCGKSSVQKRPKRTSKVPPNYQCSMSPAYEAKLLSGDASGESTPPRGSHTARDESRSKPLAELPPADTLRDIEAWIASEGSCARTPTGAFLGTPSSAQPRSASRQSRARARGRKESPCIPPCVAPATAKRLALDNRAAAQAAECSRRPVADRA